MDYSAEAWEPAPCEIAPVAVWEERLKGSRKTLATSWDMPNMHGMIVLDLWVGKATWTLVQRTANGSSCIIATGKLRQHSNPEVDL